MYACLCVYSIYIANAPNILWWAITLNVYMLASSKGSGDNNETILPRKQQSILTTIYFRKSAKSVFDH